MKRFILPVITAMTLFAVSACSDYDNGMSEKDLQYERTFSDAFGTIDPKQDWNGAAQFYVNVTTASDSRVKIYAHDGNTYRIVANYANVNGTKQLFFDAPKYIKSVLVTDGSDSQEVPVGTSVTLAPGTRATATGSGDGTIVFKKNEDTSAFLTFTRDQMAAYTKVVPESNKNGAHSNWGKVTENFTMIGTGEEYILYPMFWDSSHTNTLGIYYYDEGGVKHEVDIYTAKSGDEIRHYVPGAGWSNETDDRMFLHYFDEGGTDFWSPSAQPTKWELKGIKITVPKGLSYGFYIKENSTKYYSAAAENTDAGSCSNGEHHHGKTYTKIPHAATFEYEGRKYYCFEDWNTESSDGDLNDFNFIISGNTIPVDEEAYNWTIACEDLGNTYDIDFNDVVLNVSHISGETTATVRALAAGGSMATHVYFNDATNGVKDLGEIHHMIDPSISYMLSGAYPMLNTSAGYTPSSTASTITINVPTEWSLASLASESVSTLTDVNRNAMGGFTLKVLPKGTQDQTVIGGTATLDAKYADATIIEAPSTGETPQMICIQSPYKYTYAVGTTVNRYWGWPSEKTSIKEAYSDFAAWVQNMETATDWYKRPTAGKIAGQVDVANIGDDESTTENITKKESTLALYNMTPDSEKDGHKNYAKTLNASSGAEWVLPINTASDAAISYTSSDENVATVDADGNITVHANGTAAITITQLANKYYEAGIISIDITAEGFLGWNMNITSGQNIELAPDQESNITLTFDDSWKNPAVTYEIVSQTPETEGQSVISLEGATIKALNIGTAVVRVTIPAMDTRIQESKDINVTVKEVEYANGKTFDFTPNKTDTETYWGNSVKEYTVTVGNMNVTSGTTATITVDAISTDQIQWYDGSWGNAIEFTKGATTSTVTVTADKIINKTFQIIFWRVADPGLGANSVHITFSE